MDIRENWKTRLINHPFPEQYANELILATRMGYFAFSIREYYQLGESEKGKNILATAFSHLRKDFDLNSRRGEKERIPDEVYSKQIIPLTYLDIIYANKKNLSDIALFLKTLGNPGAETFSLINEMVKMGTAAEEENYLQIYDDTTGELKYNEAQRGFLTYYLELPLEIKDIQVTLAVKAAKKYMYQGNFDKAISSITQFIDKTEKPLSANQVEEIIKTFVSLGQELFLDIYAKFKSNNTTSVE